jgi:D-alanyl-D-alanine carboxypeptidase/D-alanyl-D-alanine-endopeptidase (penicillin-binding protein 4)
MQNAKRKHRPRMRHRAVFAFCILHFALASCAKTRPPIQSPAPPRQGSEGRARNSVTQLRQDILDATQLPGVNRASWGIVVHSIDRNERLVELNARNLFVPASIAKLVTVATAADAVGWNYRFETTLRATGPIDNGTLRGDLLIVGSGDPSIGGRGGDDLSGFVAAVRAAGINQIEGRVIGDDDAIEEPRPQLSWAWDDLGYTTGAVFGALNFAENRTVATVAPGAMEGAATSLSLEPRALARPVVNRTVTGPAGSPQLLWPEQRPGEPFLTIAGSIPAGAQPARVGISAGNPTLWFASVLRTRLIENRIAIAGEAIDVDDVRPSPDRAAATVLFSYRSHTLGEVAQPLLKESINLYGEAFLRLNVEHGAFPTNDAALDGLRKRLQSWGLPDDSYQLVDGSGLSRRDAISPDVLLAVLQRMFDASGASPFMTALPIAGVDGSLEGRMKGTAAEGNVRAKTGTMSNIRSLAGYVTTRGRERLAFVVVVNNFEGTGTAANEAIDAVAVRLAEWGRESFLEDTRPSVLKK